MLIYFETVAMAIIAVQSIIPFRAMRSTRHLAWSGQCGIYGLLIEASAFLSLPGNGAIHCVEQKFSNALEFRRQRQSVNHARSRSFDGHIRTGWFICLRGSAGRAMCHHSRCAPREGNYRTISQATSLQPFNESFRLDPRPPTSRSLPVRARRRPPEQDLLPYIAIIADAGRSPYHRNMTFDP
jgi:hypothetical protein